LRAVPTTRASTRGRAALAGRVGRAVPGARPGTAVPPDLAGRHPWVAQPAREAPWQVEVALELAARMERVERRLQGEVPVLVALAVAVVQAGAAAEMVARRAAVVRQVAAALQAVVARLVVAARPGVVGR